MIRNSTKSNAVICPNVRRPEMRTIAHNTKKTRAALMTVSIAASGIDESAHGQWRAAAGYREAHAAECARLRPHHNAQAVFMRGELQLQAFVAGAAVKGPWLDIDHLIAGLETRAESQFGFAAAFDVEPI